MRFPKLSDLPPLPPGKSGWPWTGEDTFMHDTGPDGSFWPKISIVTPSFNQGKFIEETIRSVLLQGYPNMEYIIIDGGSTDGTIEIIKKYEKWLTYWVSEPDRGQSHAINKGFNLSKGDIVAWINSDDIYLPGAFMKISRFFYKNTDVDMVFGDCSLIDEDNKIIGQLEAPPEFSLKQLIEVNDYIPQPSVFFYRNILKVTGGLDEALQYSMDYELWIRIGLHYQVRKINSVLSTFRKHSNQKTFHTNPIQYRENLWIRARYGGVKQKYQLICHLIAEKVKKFKSY